MASCLGEYFDDILAMVDVDNIKTTCCPECNAKYLRRLEEVKKYQSTDKYLTDLIFNAKRKCEAELKICGISDKVYENIDTTRKKYKTLNNLVTQIKLIFIDISILEREEICEDQHNLIGFLAMLYAFCGNWDEIKLLHELDLPIDYYWQDGLLLEIIVAKHPLSVIKEIIEGEDKNAILLAIHFNEQILLYWSLRYNKFATSLYLIKNHNFDVYKGINNLIRLQVTSTCEDYEKSIELLKDDNFNHFIVMMKECFNNEPDKIVKDLWTYTKDNVQVSLELCMEWVKTVFLKYFKLKKFMKKSYKKYQTKCCNQNEKKLKKL